MHCSTFYASTRPAEFFGHNKDLLSGVDNVSMLSVCLMVDMANIALPFAKFSYLPMLVIAKQKQKLEL